MTQMSLRDSIALEHILCRGQRLAQSGQLSISLAGGAATTTHGDEQHLLVFSPAAAGAHHQQPTSCWTHQHHQQQQETCSPVCDSFMGSSTDLLANNGSPALSLGCCGSPWGSVASYDLGVGVKEACYTAAPALSPARQQLLDAHSQRLVGAAPRHSKLPAARRCLSKALDYCSSSSSSENDSRSSCSSPRVVRATDHVVQQQEDEEDEEECTTPRAAIMPPAAVRSPPGAPRRPAARTLALDTLPSLSAVMLAASRTPGTAAGAPGTAARSTRSSALAAADSRSRLQQWLKQMELQLAVPPSSPAGGGSPASAAAHVQQQPSPVPRAAFAAVAGAAAGGSRGGVSFPRRLASSPARTRRNAFTGLSAPPAPGQLARPVDSTSGSPAAGSKKRPMPALSALSLSGAATGTAAEALQPSAAVAAAAEVGVGDAAMRSSKRRSQEDGSGSRDAAAASLSTGGGAAVSATTCDLPAPAFVVLGVLSTNNNTP